MRVTATTRPTTAHRPPFTPTVASRASAAGTNERAWRNVTVCSSTISGEVRRPCGVGGASITGPRSCGLVPDRLGAVGEVLGHPLRDVQLEVRHPHGALRRRGEDGDR